MYEPEPGTSGMFLCGEDDGDGSKPVKCKKPPSHGMNGGGEGGMHAMGDLGSFVGGGLGVGPEVGGSLVEGADGRRGRCRDVNDGLVGGLLDAVFGLLGGGRRCGGEVA